MCTKIQKRQGEVTKHGGGGGGGADLCMGASFDLSKCSPDPRDSKNELTNGHVCQCHHHYHIHQPASHFHSYHYHCR